MTPSGGSKRSYHHGDLRNALVDAAAQLAEEGGPAAITVRAAARIAGVTPTAAYRHFEGHEQLLDAAKERAMERMGAAMQVYVRALPETDDPVQRSLSTLAAIARGYIQFARSEPGLFRTAFQQGGSILDGETIVKSDIPFVLLAQALDDLVATGMLTREYRPMAEITAWSAVHGFSNLSIDGPLRDWPEHMLEQALARMLDILGRGFVGDALAHYDFVTPAIPSSGSSTTA
ncbi:TetR/AcrR family transcriptional regulator [Actinocrispum sp. NPDC049592]|uniref:TetR/AcrR family transcriptional regulator n=1 Tax=Actinocrispum sp. NPDC049592 TaxID=3154835 RepID=UPI003428F176